MVEGAIQSSKELQQSGIASLLAKPQDNTGHGHDGAAQQRKITQNTNLASPMRPTLTAAILRIPAECNTEESISNIGQSSSDIRIVQLEQIIVQKDADLKRMQLFVEDLQFRYSGGVMASE